ncbi:MAG: D-alanyl-D-alanine carboxypeptidase [Lachnospiraceae bacterium]|nr:D-alanyl-D-alanine carboxypeptidase [Lachnospiraceae bacterium]
MTEYNCYSEEEYEKKREIRRARVEAEKARQQRNRKLFFGGLILLALIAILATLIVVIVNVAGKNKKDNASADADATNGSVTASAIETSPESDEADIESEYGPAGDEAGVDTSADSSADAGKEITGAELGLSPDKFVFTADSDTVYMDSSEFTSEFGLVVRVDDGKVLAQKAGFEKMIPASMTKIMTVLTARQHISDEQLDDIVAISYNAKAYDLSHGTSSAGYEEGEMVSLRDLFYGTILPSGAEAAYMLAEYTAGSHEAFVELMNENVKALNLEDTTHFTNCVGVYDENNYSTCNDIAVILAAAMEDEFLAELLGTRRYTSTVTEQHPEGVELSNWFLRRIEDKDTGGFVCGAKTGFVNQSGSCGASMMKGDDGNTYICVSGKAWSAWRCIYDHVAAYNIYAIGNTGYHKE